MIHFYVVSISRSARLAFSPAAAPVAVRDESEWRRLLDGPAAGLDSARVVHIVIIDVVMPKFRHKGR
jgi:hypothetical protein